MTSPGTGPADLVPRLVARASGVALCLDFDGTLAPIVDDPDQALPLPGVVELLGVLAGRFAASRVPYRRRAPRTGRRAAAGRSPRAGRLRRSAPDPRG
jgi:trehalose 6-phosphate phosphatase